MPFTYNRVALIGHTGDNAITRLTNGGQRVAMFNIATDRPTRAGAAPVTDWHRIVCWDRLAEIAAEHITKGRLVLVEGALTYRTSSDQQGQQRTIAEIVAPELILLDRPVATSAASAVGQRRS